MIKTKKKTVKIKIKTLDKIEDMIMCYPLFKELYPKISLKQYKAQLAEMIKLSNYKIAYATIDDQMVSISGYWIASMFYCGRYLQLSNFVVAKKYRNNGIGKRMLRYLAKEATRQQCQKLVLDSYTENKKSHSLYFNEDFYIRGFHFFKDL